MATYPSSIGRFQREVYEWVVRAFGYGIAEDKVERGLRLVEEALELGQASGVSAQQAINLLNRVYLNPPGDVEQEIGGCAVTLAALASAHDEQLGECAWREIVRVQGRIGEVRESQARKARQGLAAELPSEREHDAWDEMHRVQDFQNGVSASRHAAMRLGLAAETEER